MLQHIIFAPCCWYEHNCLPTLIPTLYIYIYSPSHRCIASAAFIRLLNIDCDVHLHATGVVRSAPRFVRFVRFVAGRTDGWLERLTPTGWRKGIMRSVALAHKRTCSAFCMHALHAHCTSGGGAALAGEGMRIRVALQYRRPTQPGPQTQTNAIGSAARRSPVRCPGINCLHRRMPRVSGGGGGGVDGVIDWLICIYAAYWVRANRFAGWLRVRACGFFFEMWI